MTRRCIVCRAPIDRGSYCAADARGSTRAWRTVREAVLARDGHRCVVCGAPATEVDHLVTVSAGGGDEPANLRAVCRGHNPRGRDRHG